jgi:hypothetical protein
MSCSRRVAMLGVLPVLVLTTVSVTAPTALGAAVQTVLAGNELKYPCQAPFGSVQIPASAWAGGLANTGHDGATFTVYSNYRAGRQPASCAGNWASADGTDQWGLQYQCTELAVRVADAEWEIGNNTAWENAGWNGAADAMKSPGQRLGLTWVGNGTGSLPVQGDLMIWSSSGGNDPGHVGVVAAVSSGTVTFVGENQGAGMVTLPVSGTTVENNGWKPNSAILGWLSSPAAPTTIGMLTTSAEAFAKDGGLRAPWVDESGAVAKIAVASDPTNGPLIGVLTTNGTVLVKEGSLTGPWVTETTGASQIAVASDPTNGPLIAALSGTTALAKEGSLTGPWVTETTGTSQIAVASDPTNGPLIGVLTTNGTVRAKEGSLTGPWVTETTGTSQIAVAG